VPIQPFIDRPGVNLNQAYRTVTLTTGSMASGDVRPFMQGVSVRDMTVVFQKLTPLLTSMGFPATTRNPIDFSLEKTTYGIVRLFTDSDNEIDVSAYQDIATLRDPVKFLQDTGITAYPNIMLSPNWLSPGQMNGIIEPLDVRGTLAGASIDSPFVAHTIRSTLFNPPIMYTIDPSSYPAGFNEDSKFIDSQDTKMSIGKFSLKSDGISDFEPTPVAPYDDSDRSAKKNDLMIQSNSLFNDFVGVGIISKMECNTAFNFQSKRSVSIGATGIRNVTGIDSLAFGGLTK